MNDEIEKKRTDILQYFDKNRKINSPTEFYNSQTGLFNFDTECYEQNDKKRNWVITKISIRHEKQPNYLFEYYTDNDNVFFEWLHKEKNEYLLLAEFQGGQSIFDTLSQKLYSYYSEDDPLIWMEIFPSPNQTKLAVLGCYWACSAEIVVYDCTNLLELPYKALARYPNYNFKEWVNDDVFILMNTEDNKYEIITIN